MPSNRSQMSNAFLAELLRGVAYHLGITDCLVVNKRGKWSIQTNAIPPRDPVVLREWVRSNLKLHPKSGKSKILLGIYGGVRSAERGQGPLTQQIRGLAHVLRERDVLLFLVSILYLSSQ
jgi:hypothetical protein